MAGRASRRPPGAPPIVADPPSAPVPPARRKPMVPARMRARPAVTVLVLSLLALLALYGGALFAIRPTSSGTEVRLDVLTRSAAAGEVKVARLLDEDARVSGVIERLGEDPQQFWTAYPRSDAATQDLLKAFLATDTQVTVDPQETKGLVRFLAQFLLPLVILANLFALLFFLVRGGGGGGAD